MRRIIGLLAIIGSLTAIGGLIAWTGGKREAVTIVGRVLGPDRRPIPALSVYLDRGTSLVERYVTDSAGRFALPLFPSEPHRATWLICAPKAIPIVGKPLVEHLYDRTLYTYDVTLMPDSVFGFYKASGWSGPVPRECPVATDSAGWRYPASRVPTWGAYTTKEPDWVRYPGPPALPQD